MRRKTLLWLLLFAFYTTSGLAQSLQEKIEKKNVVPGAIFKDGEKIEGYIKRKPRYRNGNELVEKPWSFQAKIRFIEKEEFETRKKVRSWHFEKYYPKDILGYTYDTLEYRTLTYSDMSAIGLNMIPKKVFMRKVLDGKLSLFHYYHTPPRVAGEDQLTALYIEYSEPDLAYQKRNENKAKMLETMKVKKELSDCPELVRRFENGEYNVIGDNSGNSSAFGNFINNVAHGKKMRLQIVKDYNKLCN